MDWLLWVVRAILIVVGIILGILVWKRKKGYYSIRLFAIGGTAFALGVILLILSFITGPFWGAGLFLTVIGAILFIIGLFIRNTWEKNHNASTHHRTSLT